MPTPQIGISSWSVHRLLGKPAFFDCETPLDAITPGDPRWREALLALPAQMAARKLHTLHLCHFHLRDLSKDYLRQLRAELERHGVVLHTLLADSGDLTHPVTGQRDHDWILAWATVAAELGAQHLRAIAGKQPYSPEALALSATRLEAMAARCASDGVGVLIENWFDLLPTGAAVNELLERTGGRVQFNIDFGNFKRDKYANLAACAQHAVSSHAKGEFDGPLQLDQTDYDRCLQILNDVDYTGPYILIYDDARSDDEWAGLETERQRVLAAV
jgi:sugar phosphate isomerase/epimerase